MKDEEKYFSVQEILKRIEGSVNPVEAYLILKDGRENLPILNFEKQAPQTKVEVHHALTQLGLDQNSELFNFIFEEYGNDLPLRLKI